MACFSSDFRFAYHVLPLHASKGIWSHGLLSKNALAGIGCRLRRATTHVIDTMLGFENFVHFYLPKSTLIDFHPLPILRAQLDEKRSPPFPHAVIVVDTKKLNDADCVICNFNIAVSRPAYDGVRGGNHARGTDPAKILKHWQGFRADDPSLERRRMSEWNEPMRVPTLRGEQITFRNKDVGYLAPKHCTERRTEIPVPELLLEPRSLKELSLTLYAFSPYDKASLERLGNAPQWLTLERSLAFPWYSQADRIVPSVRKQIDLYLSGESTCLDLNFDEVRT